MHATSLFLRPNYMQQFFYNVSKKKPGYIFLVRHAKCAHNENGHCAGFYDESDPTVEGLEKTGDAGKVLFKTGIKFDILYTSPLQRACISAKVLAKELPPIVMKTDKALIERNFGGYTGMSKNMIKEQLGSESFHNYIYSKNFFPPNICPGHKYFQSKALYGSWPENHKGESYQCIINRLAPFLEKVKAQALDGQNIIIVGHSHNLQILQMLLYGNAFEQGIEKYKIEHATPVKFTLSLNSDNKLMVKEKANLDNVAILEELNKPTMM